MRGTSRVFETSKEAWDFVQEQLGKHFRWTYEKVEGGWQARPKTEAEYQAGQRTFSQLVQAHQDSLPK